MSDGIHLVVGAGGFVGGRLVAELLLRGRKVRAVSSRPVDQWLQKHEGADNYELDMRDNRNCDWAVEGDVKWIYNLAAKVGGIGYIKGPSKVPCMLSSLINTNLLRSSVNKSLSGYLFTSSACVYGDSPERAEEYANIAPSAGYGEEKLFSEQMTKYFGEEMGIPVHIVRPHTTYGPGDDIKGAEGKDHVPSALCRKVAKAKLHGPLEISIWGDGNQIRNFVTADDVVEAMIRLMNAPGAVGPFNVGSEESVTINQMVDMLEEIAAVKLARFYGGGETGVQIRKCSNLRLWNAIDWQPRTKLIDGLRATYNDIWSNLVTK